MASGIKKDVELIFRGQDRASPSIKGVRDNVRDLNKAIAEQIAAAERGEGSIDDLAKVYKRLKDAQGDVGEIAKLAAAYDKLANQHAESAVKAEEARRAEAALSAEVAAAEKPTKRLLSQRDAATRKAVSAADAEKRLAADVRLAGEAFEQAGGDLRNFEASQDAIRATALETARTLKLAGDAMDNYGASAAKGDQAIRAQAELDRFNQMAAGSGLPQGQINFISAMENRIEALTAAMRENKVSADAMAAAQARIAASNADQKVRDQAAAFREAADAADRLEAATAFKNQAAGIAAGARDIQRFGAAADTGATSAQRLADTIQRISTPTQSAVRSITGINEVLDKNDALFDGTKKRMSEYNAGLNDLAAAQAGMADMARMIDNFRDQEAAVAAATGEMQRAQGEVLQLAAAIQQAENPTQQMADQLTRAEAALERTGGAVTRETSKLRQMEAALEASAIDTRNLAAAQTALEASATRAAAQMQRIRGVSRGTGGLFGLNPNELQNLGFQVNDIIVSIASGQNPLTVFIQQGAQIGQIWPGAFTKIAARLPIIAAILAVIIPLGAAMGEAAEDARRLAEATSNIESMGGANNIGAGLDNDKLAASAEKLEEIGLKAKEANQALRDLMADGLNAAQMEQYIETAKAAATVTGVDFKEALDQVRESFQGGVEDIIALDEQTNFLNETELNHIQTMFEQGRADEARATALEIYNHRMNEAAAGARGPWSTAINQLGAAWNRFTEWLSNTAPIRIAGQAIEWLGRQAAYWSARLAGKSAGEADALSRGANIEPRQVVLPDANRVTAAGRRAQMEQERALRGAQATTAAAKRQLAMQDAQNAAIANGATNQEALNVARMAGATFDAQEGQRAAKRDDAAGRRAAAAARREAAAAQARARAIEQAEEQLARALEQIDKSVADKQTDSLAKRLAGIDSQYAKVFRDIQEYSDLTGGRGMIGDRTIQQAREHAEAQLVQLKNYERLKWEEDQLQNLLEERSNKLDAIDDRVARGIITPEAGLAEAEIVIADIAARVTGMATDALAFARTMAGANPSPEMLAFISKMETAIQNNSGGQNERMVTDRRKAGVNTAETQLNEIIQARNSLVEHENYLVGLGLQTREQAQANISTHYARTRELIQGQIADILRMAAAFRDSADPAMRLFYDNLAARMEAANLQTQPLNANFAKLKDGMNQLLTTNIIGFIEAIAQSFADLATGQGDVLDMFASIGRAFLDMIAKTLQGIAMLILQVIILDAVDKMTGGLVKPLLKLYGGAGVFHEGGVVGSAGGRSREVSPLVFANAPRYHTGGIAGLAPDETAAILRKGEEVLKETDPRHRFNGGMNGNAPAAPEAIRNVLVIGDDEIAGAMAGTPGERVVMSHLRANKAEIKQMVNN